nr:hypothetical protein [uncultured bacterium]
MLRSFYYLLFLVTVCASAGHPQIGTVVPVALPLDALHTRLELLEKRLQKKEIPADPQNLALLRLKIEQVHLQFRRIESNKSQYVLQSPYEQTKIDIAGLLTRAESIARAKGDAVYPASGQMHERAYIARADGSAQPYWIFLPRDYTPRKKWPLVVFLHGYSPQINKVEPWIPGEDIWKPATDRGFIMAVPYGRRNTDFINIGEDDTLDVTDAVTSRYNADPERTFLLGPSMGGYGVHAIGLHNAGRFAAIAPLCGRTDTYLWLNLRRKDLPAWKRVLYDADDPQQLKLNAFQLPIYMQHGAQDHIVSVEHSRRYYAELKALGFPIFYNEIRNGSHFIYFDEATFHVALDWMKRQQRPPVPRRVRFSTGTLRNNNLYWVEIDGFRDYSELAHLDAQIRDGNIIEVKTENVARFTLKPPAQFLKAGLPLTLVVDGKTVEQKFDTTVPIQWPIRTTEHPLQKMPRRAGPIKECYRDPFLLVYGSRAPGADEANARRFLKEWDDYADGLPPIKADREVTADDKKNYNLILFGTRQTNSLLAEISDQLPLEMTPDGYRLGDKQFSNEGKEIGLQLCYPSPFDPARMIVVQSGLYWGTAIDLNHKFDLLPEYIVYIDEIDYSDKTNRALTAGFFDHNWNLPLEIAATTPVAE